MRFTERLARLIDERFTKRAVETGYYNGFDSEAGLNLDNGSDDYRKAMMLMVDDVLESELMAEFVDEVRRQTFRELEGHFSNPALYNQGHASVQLLLRNLEAQRIVMGL